MVRLRIGKDIPVRWRVKTNGQDEALEGRDLTLILTDRYGNKTVLPFSVTDINRIGFTWYGKDQKCLGEYVLTLLENAGKEKASALDVTDFVTLVQYTTMEGGETEDNLEIEPVVLEGNITANGRGESAYEVWLSLGNEGTEQDFIDSLKGAKGDTGEQGEKGEKGDKGDPGEKGDKGDPGEKGEKGDTGEKGEKGDTGATGQQGPQGEKGDTGETGLQGPKGDTGETGPQGAIGPKGDPLTWEDLTEEQKESLRGPKGDPGDPATVTEENVKEALGYVPGDDDKLVHKTGDETIKGVKAFDAIRAMVISLGEAPLDISLTPAVDFSGGTGVSIGNEPSILTNVRDPKLRYDAANKQYVDEEVGKRYSKPADGIPESDLSEEVKTKLDSGGGSSINVVDNLTSDSATDALSAQQGKALKSLADAKTGFTDIGTFTVGESYAGSLGVAILANHTPKAGDAFIGTDNEDGFRHTALVIRNDDVLFNFLYSSAEDNFMQFVSIMRQTGAVMAEYKMVADSEIERWNGKQDKITDLATIRSGAAKGATAYQKPSTGIPSTDLSQSVQQTLAKVEDIYQDYIDANNLI